jgi:hypothetical protein
LQLAHALVTFSMRLDASALQTSNCNHAFAIGQALGVGREVEKKEMSAEGPDNGCRTLNDEKPSSRN